METKINIHPVPSAPIKNLILDLAKTKLQEVNYQTGNHQLLIPYLGQKVKLEMLVYVGSGCYNVEVLNHFFKM